MRRILWGVLALLLAASLAGAAAAAGGTTVIACPEQGFTTLADFDCATEWQDDVGLYVYTEDTGYIPYILIYFNDGPTRITDPDAYISDVEIPRTRERFGKNGGMQFVQRGDFTLNGRSMPNVEMEYKNADGVKIYSLMVIDIQEGFTTVYRARYVDPDRAGFMRQALATLQKNLRPDAKTQPAPPKRTDTAPKKRSKGDPPKRTEAASPTQTMAPPPAAGASALSIAVTPIVQGGMTLGRCAAPEGYTVQGMATCSVREQSAGNPWLLRVGAQAPDGMTNLIYMSAMDYIDDGSGQDGVYHAEYFTPRLHYMTAGEYCDYWLNRLVANIRRAEVVEEDTYPGLRSMLSQRERAMLEANRTLLAGTGVSADRVALSLVSRRYHVVTESGLEAYFCVAAATRGSWFTAALPGPYVDIRSSYALWEAPYLYTMLCPVHLWQERGGAFSVFMENTTASDQFIAANRRLSDELWDIITGRGTDSADAYSRDVMRQETRSGDDYDEERFTDYLFDQNDYTLSDGRHVKVSTAYDYVYEGDDGNVYYSDSAFAQPGGSVQLTPNH